MDKKGKQRGSQKEKQKALYQFIKKGHFITDSTEPDFHWTIDQTDKSHVNVHETTSQPSDSKLSQLNSFHCFTA